MPPQDLRERDEMVERMRERDDSKTKKLEEGGLSAEQASDVPS